MIIFPEEKLNLTIIFFAIISIFCLAILFYENVEKFSPILPLQKKMKIENVERVPRNWLEEDPMDYKLRNHYWQTGERRPLFATKNYE